ncbi:unnamed protein product [Psylliodes chrysocephalus]|uniref:Uncharacterized protein n=1 Tax=Psylliodes chrysocephalus TaxID=3402493 RepID=A0A9P0D4T3_9CUCU|nr:unnamed protein product [Psylliodes chrysocephala]
MYYHTRIESSKKGKGNLWSIINELRGKSTHKSCNTNINPFNTFYCNIDENATKNLNRTIDLLDFVKSSPIKYSFFLRETNSLEILKVCNDIHNKTASGYDEMSVCYI